MTYFEKVQMFQGTKVTLILKGVDKPIVGTIFEITPDYVVVQSDRSVNPPSGSCSYTQPADKYSKYIPMDTIALIEYEKPEEKKSYGYGSMGALAGR